MTRVTRDTLAELRRQQYSEFHDQEPGSWHEAFTSEEPERPIVRFGKAQSHQIGKSAEKEDSEEEGVNTDEIYRSPGWDPAVVSSFFANNKKAIGSIPCVAEFAGNRYAAGMTVVTGGGNTGKTPFLHALAAELGGEEGYQVIRFGEPLSGYTSDIGAFLSELSLALLHDKVIVIDSLKDVINSSTGAAAVGGLSRAAFSFLSDIGSLAATRGCVVLTAMNPSSRTDRVSDEVTEAVISNATTVITPKTDSGDGHVVWELTTRTGEGLERLKWDISMKYGDYSVVEIESRNSQEKAKPDGFGNIELPSSSLEDPALASIFKRGYR
nr:MAG: hypothetical protein 3 [Henan cystovirus 2]